MTARRLPHTLLDVERAHDVEGAALNARRSDTRTVKPGQRMVTRWVTCCANCAASMNSWPVSGATLAATVINVAQTFCDWPSASTVDVEC